MEWLKFPDAALRDEVDKVTKIVSGIVQPKQETQETRTEDESRYEDYSEERSGSTDYLDEESSEGEESSSFKRAMYQLDDMVKKDEKLSIEKAANNARLLSKREGELNETREMNRVLATQLQLIQQKMVHLQKKGNLNEAVIVKYDKMKKKLSSVTGVLEDVTITNQSLLTKNEELQSRIKTMSENEKMRDKAEPEEENMEFEALQKMVQDLAAKNEMLKRERVSYLEGQAKTEAKVSAQKNSISTASTQIAELSVANTTLTIKNNDLSDRLADAKKEAKAANDLKLNVTKEKERLEKHISELFVDLDDMTETSKDLMARNEKLVTQIVEENRSVQGENSNQDQDQQHFMSEIRARKMALTQKVADLNCRLGEAMTQVKENEIMANRIEELENEVKYLRDEKQNLKAVQAKFVENAQKTNTAITSVELSEQQKINQSLRLDIAGLQVRLDHANEELKAAETAKPACEKAEQLNHESQIEIKHLGVRIDQLERENKSLQSEKKRLKKMLENSAVDLEVLTNSKMGLEERAKELESKNKNLQKQKRQSADRKEALSAMVDAMASKIESLKQERRRLEEGQASVERQVTVHKNSVAMASTEISLLKAKNSALENIIDEVKCELKESQEQSEKIEQEERSKKSALEKELRALQSKNESCCAKIDEQNNDLVLEQRKKKTCEDDLIALQFDYDSSCAQISELEKQKNALAQQNQDVQAKYDSCCEELDVLREGIEAQSDSSVKMIQKLQANIGEAKQENHSLKKALADKDAIEENISELAAENTSLKGKVSELDAKNKSLEEKIIQLDAKKAELETAIAEVNGTLDDANRQIHIARENSSGLERVNKDLKEEVSTLQDKLESLQEESSLVETQASVHRSSLTIASTQIAELNAKNVALEINIRDLNKKLDDAKEEIHASQTTPVVTRAIERVNDKWKKKVDRLEQQNSDLEFENAKLARINKMRNDMTTKKNDEESGEAGVEIVLSRQSTSQRCFESIEMQAEFDVTVEANKTLASKNTELQHEIQNQLKEINKLSQGTKDRTQKLEQRNIELTKKNKFLQAQIDADTTELQEQLKFVSEANETLDFEKAAMESQISMHINMINEQHLKSQTTIQGLEQANHELQKETENLQEQLEKVINERNNLLTDDDVSRSEINLLKERIKGSEEEVEQLESKISCLNKEIEVSREIDGKKASMAEVVATMANQIERLKQEKKEHLKDQISLKTQIGEHENSMADASSKIDELSAKRNALETEIQELNDQLQDCTRQIKKMNDGMAASVFEAERSKLDAMNKLNEKWQAKIDKLEQSYNEEKDTPPHKAEDELMKSRLAELENEKHDLLEKNAALAREEVELNAKYEVCCSELVTLKASLEAPQNAERSTHGMASGLSAKNIALESILASLSEKLVNANRETETAKQAMSVSVSEYTSKLEELTKTSEECRSKIADLEKCNGELEDGNKALLQEQKDMKTKYYRCSLELETAQLEIEKQRAKHEEAMASSAAEITELHGKVSALTELRAELKKYQKDLEDQKYSNGVFQNLISQMNKMNDELKTQYQQKKTEVVALQKLEEETLSKLEKKLGEVTRDRDTARLNEQTIASKVDELVNANERIEKTLKDWKRVSKGKMRQLNFVNSNLEKSNQEKAKEIQRLRAQIVKTIKIVH